MPGRPFHRPARSRRPAGSLPARLLTGALRVALAVALVGIPAEAAGQAEAPAVRLAAEPASLVLERGTSATLQVRALDGDGAPVDAPVRLVGPRGVLEVEGETVTAREVGEHELVATLTRPGAEPLTLRIPVTVTWPPVASVRIRAGWDDGAPAASGAGGGDPAPGDAGVPTLYAGTTVPFAATARHADGSPRPDAQPAWSSSAPAVATVDPFGHVTAHAPGTATLTAAVDGVRGESRVEVAPFPAAELRLEGGPDTGPAPVRTGDVLEFRAVAVDEAGREIPDLPVTWAHHHRPTAYEATATAAPGQLDEGRFVADVPGVHTVVATAGPLSARRAFEVEPRDAVRELELVGHGLQNTMRTTDFWVFEGLDGRDYAITGSKRADGHAYVFDVTDPANIVKTDSVQVDARAVNDVKVSPDGRYATMTREGASDRRNGVVILDLADPAHPVIASEVTERLTGGVHNAFPTDTHVFALSDGDKYVILDVADIYAPRIVSEYDHPDSRVHDVWVHDGLAFSAEWGTGVVVVDVGNGRWGGSIENPVFVTSYPLPTGRTHAVFPYEQESTGKYYLFVGDEIMNRRGRAWAGYPRSMGSYADQYDPGTGIGGIPLTTAGYIQVIDFTDPESPEMVARYEVPEYGTHNIWVEDDVLYQAYYEGGLRVVDVSGPLMGNLYTQGREMAVFKSADPDGYTPNATMVWSAMPHKGHVFFTDTNSGLWAVKIQPPERPIS